MVVTVSLTLSPSAPNTTEISPLRLRFNLSNVFSRSIVLSRKNSANKSQISTSLVTSLTCRRNSVIDPASQKWQRQLNVVDVVLLIQCHDVSAIDSYQGYSDFICVCRSSNQSHLIVLFFGLYESQLHVFCFVGICARNRLEPGQLKIYSMETCH